MTQYVTIRQVASLKALYTVGLHWSENETYDIFFKMQTQRIKINAFKLNKRV